MSPEKTTRLGAGHFIETLADLSRGRRRPVAISRNALFRYTPANDVMRWDEIARAV